MFVVLDGHICSLVSRDLVSCADVCFVSNSCSGSVRFAQTNSTNETHFHQSLPHEHEIYSFSGHFPASWNLIHTPCELEGSKSKCSSPRPVYSIMASSSDCAVTIPT